MMKLLTLIMFYVGFLLGWVFHKAIYDVEQEMRK